MNDNEAAGRLNYLQRVKDEAVKGALSWWRDRRDRDGAGDFLEVARHAKQQLKLLKVEMISGRTIQR